MGEFEATDLVLAKLADAGLPFANVKALSGAGQVFLSSIGLLPMMSQLQQHGSVYWKSGAGQLLASLASAQGLHEQLKVRPPFSLVSGVRRDLV